MNRIILLASLLASSCVAVATPCVEASLQDYVDLDYRGCQHFNATFRSFDVIAGPVFANPIDASLVQVLPTGSYDQPALRFTLGQTASSDEFVGLFFRFDIVPDRVTDGFLRLTGASADGDGVALGVVDICRAGVVPTDSPQGCITQPDSLIAIQTNGFRDLMDQRVLVSWSLFEVFVSLSVDGGSSGSAGLESATVGFTAVPEPGTAILALSGIVFAISSRQVRKSSKRRH